MCGFFFSFILGCFVDRPQQGHSMWLVQHCARDILEALAFLHREGYVHADLKPRNILWSADDECFKLIDFGLTFKEGNQVGVSGEVTGAGGGGIIDNCIFSLSSTLTSFRMSSTSRQMDIVLQRLSFRTASLMLGWRWRGTQAAHLPWICGAWASSCWRCSQESNSKTPSAPRSGRLEWATWPSDNITIFQGIYASVLFWIMWQAAGLELTAAVEVLTWYFWLSILLFPNIMLVFCIVFLKWFLNHLFSMAGNINQLKEAVGIRKILFPWRNVTPAASGSFPCCILVPAHCQINNAHTPGSQHGVEGNGALTSWHLTISIWALSIRSSCMIVLSYFNQHINFKDKMLLNTSDPLTGAIPMR